jgi:CRP-like cAMP-binding protein
VVFHFHKAEEGKVVARQGESCDKLTFLMSGQLEAKTEAPHARFSLSEVLVPCVTIEPQSLFGMHNTFKATYCAKEESKLLTIDKSFISSELINYEVLLLNFFNILSNRCQTLQQKLWTSTSPTIKDKIVHFLLMRCQLSYGEKTLHISMDHLANMIDETRINVSRTLNEWQEKEWIQLRRKEIYIPKFERLIQDLM